LLDKAHALLIDSHFENARIIVDAHKVQVHSLPRAGDVDELSAVFKFPSDDKERAALDALRCCVYGHSAPSEASNA